MIACSILFALFSIGSAQLAAWPATSYSPFYQALFAGAHSPVLAAHVPRITAPELPLAAPFVRPFLPVAAPVFPPVPVFRPALAPFAVPAAPVLRGPAFAYAPSPVLTPVRPVLMAPAVVPAYAQFVRTAMFIGSRKP